ncbi:MAG: glycine C-acetyltransferase [bacterium]|nr:glycine C-acetyltransferase [bacterium]
MYPAGLLKNIVSSLDSLRNEHRFKHEVAYATPQGAEVEVKGKKVLQFAANNYLGLANHPMVVAAAKKALGQYGYGTASVRFICGTQEIHCELERRLAKFLGTEDVILFSSCFAANEAFFATIVNDPLGDAAAAPDFIYSDELNHASIIDGLRLCKGERVAKRIYPHKDLAKLEAMLKEDAGKSRRFRIIATDGVFSMEGTIAPLPELVALAEKYEALLFVDDSHGVGALGKRGAGAPEQLGVHGRIDVLSGTFGKALGGAMGGYLAGKKELVDFMRQKARPYIFSNSLPPVVAATTIAVLDLLEKEPQIVQQLHDNTVYFRREIQRLGFTIIPGEHAIVPVMLGEAKTAQAFSRALLADGVYVVGLWFPVVPEGEARLRVQISAGHTRQHLDAALAAFAKVGKELEIIHRL